MEEETNLLTTEERVKESANKIISSIIKTDEVSATNRNLLFSRLPETVFRDENYILYLLFYKQKDSQTVPNAQFIKLYLLRNLKTLSQSSQYINLDDYSDLDADSTAEGNYIAGVLKHYDELMQKEVLDTESFKVEIEIYKQEYSAYIMSDAFGMAKQMLYEKVMIGRREYQGYDDAVAYVKHKSADIDDVMDKTAGAGFIDSSKMALKEEDKEKPIKIGDFGAIEELNAAIGGVYTGNFYNIMAPTKGGKSKFTTMLVYIMMTKYGQNVSVWAHEGGYQAWWAQLRAIHFHRMYILDKASADRVAPLSQKDILFGTYPNDNIREMEMNSAIDLFNNEAYGKVNMIDRPFKVETWLDEVETSVQINESKCVLIDYLQLIDWDNKCMSKPQAIGKAYQAGLAYCKKRNVALISPSQFTQDFMNEMSKSKQGQSHEVRTAGGESSEIVRTPDYNIALYASAEDLLRKEMTLMCVPSRLAEPFPDIPIYADLGTCYFQSRQD